MAAAVAGEQRDPAPSAGKTVTAGRLYDIVRARLLKRFGKDMCLHDFRRSATSYLAMDDPKQIGIVPGLLQQASPEVGERHYNLANGVKVSQRFAQNLALTKKVCGQRTQTLRKQSAIWESQKAREHIRPLFVRSAERGID